MHQHPDHFLKIVQSRVSGYDKHAAIHRHEAVAALRIRRRAAWESRWFRLRYWARNMAFRFVPGIAKRMAL